jgi:hypothetical protein
VPHPNSKRAKAARVKRQRDKADAPSSTQERIRDLSERETRRSKESARKRHRALARRIRTIAGASLAAVAIVVGGWFVFRPGAELDGVERPPNEGRGHVDNAAFASSTPTSGAHSSRAPTCGVYQRPLELELAVHALEHGTVVLWYDEDQPALAEGLIAATRRWDSHVIISPSSDLAAPVVATAWRRQMSYNSSADVADFVETYRNRGPERVSCDIT